MIVDWQRGNIPYHELPPKDEEEAEKTAAADLSKNPIELAEQSAKLNAA